LSETKITILPGFKRITEYPSNMAKRPKKYFSLKKNFWVCINKTMKRDKKISAFEKSSLLKKTFIHEKSSGFSVGERLFFLRVFFGREGQWKGLGS
jgi:hypothetical protein